MQIWLFWLYWKFWTDLIQSDQKINKIENLKKYISLIIWSSLIHFIHFGQIWLNLIKKNKVENLMIYFNDYFIRNSIWSIFIHFYPFWTDLIQFDQKNWKMKIWWYILMIISSEIGKYWKRRKIGKSVRKRGEKHFKSFC